MFSSFKENNVIMRVYQPSIPVDETRLPRMISGLMTDIPAGLQKNEPKKKKLKKEGET